MYWIGEFWLSWAAKEAQRSWYLYRRDIPTPAVEKVEPNIEGGYFVVTFANGERFEVAPSGIARPLRITRV